MRIRNTCRVTSNKVIEILGIQEHDVSTLLDHFRFEYQLVYTYNVLHLEKPKSISKEEQCHLIRE